MKTSLCHHIASIDEDAVVFDRKGAAVTAGDIRRVVACGRDAIDNHDADRDCIVLCESAAMQLAGILVAALSRRRIILPAHGAKAYLDEIGARDAVILGDTPIEGFDPLLLGSHGGNAASAFDDDAPDPQIRFFTSGSTGAPKPVDKPLSCLEREALVLHSLWPDALDNVQATVSHRHIYGFLYRIIWPVFAGYVSADRHVDYWEELEEALTPTTMFVTSPAHLSRMPEDLRWGGMRPGLVFCSGAPLSLAAARDARQKLGIWPTEVLGSTETGGIATRQQSSENVAWRAIPGVRPAADDQAALTVTSPFIEGHASVRMGDQVKFNDDGSFQLLGRLDRLVKIEGKRVSLPRIEEALRSLPELEDAAVIDLDGPRAALAAAVVLSPPAKCMLSKLGAYRYAQTLRQALNDRLEPSEKPKRWRFLESLPIDSQGKRPAGLIRSLFAPEDKRLPPHTLLSIDDRIAIIEMQILSGLDWFEGHFAGYPILAGIVQLHLCVLFSEKLWAVGPKGQEVSKLKFRVPIRPESTVRLHLAWNATMSCLKFRYELSDKLLSEGVIGGG